MFKSQRICNDFAYINSISNWKEANYLKRKIVWIRHIKPYTKFTGILFSLIFVRRKAKSHQAFCFKSCCKNLGNVKLFYILSKLSYNEDLMPTKNKSLITFLPLLSFCYQKTEQGFLEAEMKNCTDTADRHVSVYDLLHILLITVSLPSTYICFSAIIIFQGHC